MNEKEIKTSWKSTQSEISKAIEGWATVTEQLKQEPKVAPDEKMLKDIEGIIQIIKSKLEEFAPPSTQQTSTPPASLSNTQNQHQNQNSNNDTSASITSK